MHKPLLDSHSIVWVDDDHDDLEVFTKAITEVDPSAHATILHNGRELLDYLQHLQQSGKHFPCLIILDINMPLLNGRETLVLMKNTPEYKDLPVVVFTTSANPLDKAFCKKFDTVMFTKPHSYNDLKQSIKSILGACAH